MAVVYRVSWGTIRVLEIDGNDGGSNIAHGVANQTIVRLELEIGDIVCGIASHLLHDGRTNLLV